MCSGACRDGHGARVPHRATGLENGAWGPVQPGIATLPALLREAGYQTAALGKMHFLPYANPRTLCGFEYAELHEEGRIVDMERRGGINLGGEDYHDYLHKVGYGGYERAHGIGNNDIRPAPSPLPAKYYESAWVVDRTIDWLDNRRDPGKPFFAWASFTRPHAPFDPPEPFHSLYDPRSLPPPVGTRDDLAGKNPWLSASPSWYGWDQIASPELIQNVKAYYYGLVSFVDQQIGRLIAYLEKENLSKDTLICFTSDHGELLGDFGLFFKANMLEPSIHVPFFLHVPGGGARTDERLVGLEDILPTFLDFAGIAPPDDVDGISLLDDSKRREFYVSHSASKGLNSYMVRSGALKYVYNECEGVEELYDLGSDPTELQSLVSFPAWSASLSDLRSRLIAWCLQAGDTRCVSEGKLTKAPLSRLEATMPPLSDALGLRWY